MGPGGVDWDAVDEPARYDEGEMRSTEPVPVEVDVRVGLDGVPTPLAVIWGRHAYRIVWSSKRKRIEKWWRYEVSFGHQDRWLWWDGRRWYVQRPIDGGRQP